MKQYFKLADKFFKLPKAKQEEIAESVAKEIRLQLLKKDEEAWI